MDLLSLGINIRGYPKLSSHEGGFQPPTKVKWLLNVLTLGTRQKNDEDRGS